MSYYQCCSLGLERLGLETLTFRYSLGLGVIHLIYNPGYYIANLILADDDYYDVMGVLYVKRCVDYASDGQPVFVPAELQNVTVVEGNRATLLCRVYGDVSTRLQVCYCIVMQCFCK